MSRTRRAPAAPETGETARIPRQPSSPEWSEAIRVFLVIDPTLIRGAVTALLSGEDGIEVVGGTAAGDHVVATAVRHRPDVVVLDVELCGPDALALAQALHQRLPECRVVLLVTALRPGLVVRALDLPLAGAVDTNAQPRRLVSTIRKVAKGTEPVIDPALAVAAVGVSGSNPLTARELEVLALAAGGATPFEVAERLSLTRGTVNNYLSRVITKLGARSRVDAIRIARESGWI